MQSSFVLCLGSCVFPIVDLTFHRQLHHAGTMRASCRDSRACLRSQSNAGTRTISTVEVVLGSCRYCSSKPCLLFGPFETRFLQQRWLRKKYTFGTGTSCDRLKIVLNRAGVDTKMWALLRSQGAKPDSVSIK